MRVFKALSVFLISFFAVSLVSAEQVTVAVASNFIAAMRALAADFEQQSAHRVTLVAGSSGKLYTQIVNGAPYHLFLSADQTAPEALKKRDLLVPGTRFTYAVGRLVLWSATEGKVDSEGAVLAQQTFRKLAIANPRVAPYGVAATEVLRHLGFEEKTKTALVRGESIGQAYQFVASGNAELGFVALAQLIANDSLDSGSAWLVPDSLHSAIKQDAALLRKGEGNPAARALVEYLHSPRAQKIVADFGYSVEHQ